MLHAVRKVQPSEEKVDLRKLTCLVTIPICEVTLDSVQPYLTAALIPIQV